MAHGDVGQDRPTVRPGGSGTAADAHVVAERLSRISTPFLSAMRRAGTEVVACRGAVTDFAVHLRGKIPRGWEVQPPERQLFWDDVPGAYLPESNEVVIATTERQGQRAVPPKGFGHGAFDLVIHETMHGYDYRAHPQPSRSGAVKAAWQADFESLDPYEQQRDGAGLEEAYAESAARFFAADPDLESDWPNLFSYWGFTNHSVIAPTDFVTDRPLQAQPGSIGLARVLEDGAVELDLRADGDHGEIGHARVVYAPLDAGHRALSERIFASPFQRLSARFFRRPIPRPKLGATRLVPASRLSTAPRRPGYPARP